MFATYNPMNTTVTPEDLTGVAVFFASDEALVQPETTVHVGLGATLQPAVEFVATNRRRAR